MSENKLATMPLDHYQNVCGTIRENLSGGKVLINKTIYDTTTVENLSLDLETVYVGSVTVYLSAHGEYYEKIFKINETPRELLNPGEYGWYFEFKDDFIGTYHSFKIKLDINNNSLTIFTDFLTHVILQEGLSKIKSFEVPIHIENIVNESYDEGYDIGEEVGYSSGFEEGYETGNNDGYNEGYDLGTEDGAMLYYIAWWSFYQTEGARTNYANAFFNFGWNDYTYNPQYLINSTSSSNMFAWSHIINTKVPIKISDTNAASAVFSNCKLLETILSLDIENYNQTYTNWFVNCENLKNIAIIGYFKKNVDFKESKQLTKESIINIVNALDPNGLLSNELTLYLSLKAVDEAFEEIISSTSGDSVNPGSATTEWAELVATKPNWKIELI